MLIDYSFAAPTIDRTPDASMPPRSLNRYAFAHDTRNGSRKTLCIRHPSVVEPVRFLIESKRNNELVRPKRRIIQQFQIAMSHLSRPYAAMGCLREAASGAPPPTLYGTAIACIWLEETIPPKPSMWSMT